MGTPPEMESGPSKVMEALFAILIPPACREEVLGDLHERYQGRAQYFLEGCLTVPMVILSRIRRTTDFGVLLLEALALYLSFAGGARLLETPFLSDRLAYLRLSIPIASALLALVLADAYAPKGRRLILGPAAALVGILLQAAVLRNHSELALPSFRMILLGSVAGMLLVTALRLLFDPGDHHITGA